MKQKKGFVSFWTATIAILLALVVWRVVIVWQFNRATGDSSATTQGAGHGDAGYRHAVAGGNHASRPFDPSLRRSG